MDINNIEILEYIVNSTDYLEDGSATQGIAKKIIAEKSECKLSKKQEAVFNKYILPLLNPFCEGVFGDGESCNGNGLVDKENILLSYMEDNMLCQTCRHDKEKIELK